jgi:hypothetical protein
MCDKSGSAKPDPSQPGRGTERDRSATDPTAVSRLDAAKPEPDAWFQSLMQKIQQVKTSTKRRRGAEKPRGTHQSVAPPPNGPPGLPIPRVCAGEGIYKVRLYLDSEKEFFRSVHVHQSQSRKVACFDPGSCEICKHVEALGRKWNGAWRYRRKEICLAYVWIYSAVGKVAQTSERGLRIFWGYQQLGDEIAKIVCNLESTEEMARFFDPTCPFPLLVVVCQDYGVRVTMSLSRGIRRKVPALPEYVPPISRCWFPADEPTDPKSIEHFIQGMNRAYKNSLRDNPQE